MSRIYIPTDAADLAKFAAGHQHEMLADAEHHEEMFEHYKRVAQLDASYARWCCGSLARDNAAVHGNMLKRLDAWLEQQKMARPSTFDNWFATMSFVP